jgi:GAF domain-containing protein/HAMP domain-containing protein
MTTRKSSDKDMPRSSMDRYSRNGFIITLSLMAMAVPSAAIFAYFGFSNNLPQLFIPAVALMATTFFDLFPLSLIRKGRTNLAMTIVIAAFTINVLIVPFVVQGLGTIIALILMVVILAITGLAMTSNYSSPGTVAALLFGIAAVALDVALDEGQIRIPQLAEYSTYIAMAIAIPILIIVLREFNRFSLQTKITLGIMLTGGVTVAMLTFFGLNRANVIVSSLAEKFEANVTTQTESQISSIVQTEADKADAFFAEITSEVISIADYLSNLDMQRDVFLEGTYWNAAERVFQLPGGQYGNSGTDLASVYIPNTYTVDEELVKDLNTAVHLDFVSPDFLEKHSEVAALYYISTLGYTLYYPNIDLAENISPGFDPTTEPFFTIANPRNNPDRLPRWTTPYQDPAGRGMIVTLSIPVYSRAGVFRGVIGVDIQLESISSAIANIKLGETGYPILLDRNGLILVMPPAGYEIFGLEPEIIPPNENPKQNIFGRGSDEIQVVTAEILSGETGLKLIRPNGVETYIAYTPLRTTDYRLAVIAPVNELNSEIVASRTEVQNEIETSLQGATLLLITLFMGALVVSLLVGQIITRPMKQLTSAVEKITSGDLSARVEVQAQDETGVLARSFNEMTERLDETLQGLEGRIADRTNELEKISRSNAYRASQFESIARISRAISSTQTLDKLLPQITETISDQLGFYHVGIFLLDVHKEDAVLAASNSEGGKKMLERGHRLRVGETGIVGFVARAGEPRVALDVGLDAVFFNNPDLPNTHSEIALPLRIGAEIIGALDVQSTDTNAFSQEDVNILSTLADQVGIAIQNARSYQQSREALEQAEITAAQMSEQQWSKFLSRQSIAGYHFDGLEARPLESADNIQDHSLAIPLILRGTRIGTLKLSTADPSRTWDEHEIAMAQATAERTAIAIESARLLQEAQKRAAKERTIGQISARIGNLVSLENILQTTIQELGNTLPGTDVAIQFTSGNSDENTRAGE